MRYFLTLTFILSLFSIAKTQYLIKGEIKELKENDKVFLIFDHTPQDSAIVKNGKFELTGNINYHKLATIGVYEERSPMEGFSPSLIKFREFYLTSSPIHLKGHELNTAIVDGGPLNTIHSKYWFESERLRTWAMQMNAAYFDNIKNGTLTDEAAKKHQDNLQEYKKLQSDFDISFLENNTLSLFSADLMERHINQFNVLRLEKKFHNIPFTSIDSLKRKKLGTAIERYKKLAIGSKAPAFTLLDIDGKEVSLESFKGKTVLLDFWASWCIPCRKENPEYLAIYENFKDKNFEIVAVSFNKENEKEAWLKAIHDDKVSEWKHLSDLKGYRSPIYKLYEIGGLPQSYLLDENGIIIGQNLKRHELKSKLTQILK